MPRGRVMTWAEASKDEPPGQQRGTKKATLLKQPTPEAKVSNVPAYCNLLREAGNYATYSTIDGRGMINVSAKGIKHKTKLRTEAYAF